MSIKHFVLLLIFLLNSVATSLADSIHIELENDSTSTEKSIGHHDHADSDDEHCKTHGECHSTHYHHYLTSEIIPVIGSDFFTYIEFNTPSIFYRSNSLEIIKPPLLLS